MNTRVENLEPGDLVDLEDDAYATRCPEHEDGCPDVDLYQYEYGVVQGIERETADCVRVDFTNYESVGFPIGWLVATAFKRVPMEISE